MERDVRLSRGFVGGAKRVALRCALALIVVLSPTLARAQCAMPVGRIVRVDRTVTLSSARGAAATAAAANTQICLGGLIRTGDRSRATIALNDNTRLVIDQNTEWEVVPPQGGASGLVRLIRGAILVITRQRNLRVETPFVNAGVEGTEFLVNVEADRADITVFEGQVQAFSVVQPNVRPLSVRPGQTARAERGANPRILDVTPPDAVRWRLYYQPIIEPLLRAQLDAAPATLEALTATPAAARDALSYAREAALRLDSGDVDGAEAAVKNALNRDPNLAEAHAIRVVSAVMRNDQSVALEAGRAAAQGNSIPGHLANSYALQASLNIEGARDTLTSIAPGNRTADVWVRLSELYLALGDVAAARAAADQAFERNSDRLETLTARGFVALADADVSTARQIFDDAVRREPGDAQSRLGLGLARIHGGNLTGGREELEIAAALNPGDAVIRSYLGKAYFDERLEQQSGRQFEVAAKEDPNDPTPLFYSALQKQSTNRPVEALGELQKAIDLNDARGVYRSRALLDEDLAARSASLGHIYRDLGFEQRALLEGWRSLGADSGDYSGHRFLADMYSALPRHEVARVSELLQAQLFQPLSITHVSPSLAETDLALLETAGPSTPSLNDFNPLFRRNRLSTQVTGLFGGHDLAADEAIVSGLWNRVAFSVGQFHYETTGVRPNNDQDRDLGNVFVQAQLSRSTMVQGEVRAESSRTGDLAVRFDPTFFEPNLRNRTSGTTARFGARHNFGLRSQLIASLAVQSRDFNTRVRSVNEAFGFFSTVDARNETSGVTAEARHLYGRGRFTFDYGGGFYRAEQNRIEKFEVGFLSGFPPGFSTETSFDDQPRQANGYLYVRTPVLPRLNVTMGASIDKFDSTLFDRTQFNPKLAASWALTPSTMIRVAAFRTLTRAVIAEQTIEPTQVAGFNQFFADEEGATSWRYGAAVDHRVGATVFAGAEYSWRDLTIPVEVVDPLGNRVVGRLPRAEQLGRAYLYVAPERHVAASVEYLAERDAAVAGSDRAESGLLSLRSHRLPLTVNVFASRLFGRFRADFVRQSARYFEGLAHSEGTDTFWVVSGRVGYRIPDRYGRLVLDVANAFDQREFRYEATDPRRPDLARGRVVTFRFELGL
jgi:tetratricopeptide (TPR) repeat protein